MKTRPPEFTFQNTIPYQFKKSLRAKRLRLALSLQGLEVVIPRWISEKRAMKFVASKQDWIKQEWEKIQKHREDLPYDVPLRYHTGSHLLYRGELKELVVKHASVVIPEVEIGKETLSILLPDYIVLTQEEKVSVALEKYFKAVLRSDIEAAIDHYGEQLGLHPRSFALRKQRTRWGSCSHRGNLNFNLALVMTPREVLEYVVIHELCHLKHPNHSKSFWQLVASVCPTYKTHQQWLKAHATLIEVMGSY